MKICLINWKYNLNYIKKYIDLIDYFNSNNIEIIIFIISKEFYHLMITVLKPQYNNYLKYFLLLDNCDLTSYNLVILSIDHNFEKKMTDLKRINNIINYNNNIIFYKFRICNDFHPVKIFPNKFEEVWIPSKIYLKNSLLFDYCLNIKEQEIINKIDYVKPFEISKKYNYKKKYKNNIIKKYNIDLNKSTLLFKKTIIGNKLKNIQKENYITENFIYNKIANNKELNKKYNILIHENPYGINKINFNDYEYLMNNIINCIIGSISTSKRESLLYKIPVLNIHPNYYKGISYEELLNTRFNNSVSYKDEYEGLEATVEENWIPKIEELLNTNFNYENKSNIWFSGQELEHKIYDLLSLPEQ